MVIIGWVLINDTFYFCTGGGEVKSGAKVKKDEGIVVCRLPVILLVVADLALQSSSYVAGG